MRTPMLANNLDPKLPLWLPLSQTRSRRPNPGSTPGRATHEQGGQQLTVTEIALPTLIPMFRTSAFPGTRSRPLTQTLRPLEETRSRAVPRG